MKNPNLLIFELGGILIALTFSYRKQDIKKPPIKEVLILWYRYFTY